MLDIEYICTYIMYLTFVCMYICLCAHTYVCVFMCLCIYVRVCMRACACMCMYVINVCINIHATLSRVDCRPLVAALMLDFH